MFTAKHLMQNFRFDGFNYVAFIRADPPFC